MYYFRESMMDFMVNANPPHTDATEGIVTERAVAREAFDDRFAALLKRDDLRGAITALRTRWDLFGSHALRDEDHPVGPDEIDVLWSPRQGRRFSLAGLPDSRPKHDWRWRDHLPWAPALREERIVPLREALGCGDDTPEAEATFRGFLQMMLDRKLYMRVIRLAREQPIRPCIDPGARCFRLDQWLPEGWSHELDVEHDVHWLHWTRPTRFACPSQTRQFPTGRCPLWWGDVTSAEIKGAIDLSDGVARWLKDGAIWVLATPTKD